MISRDSDRNADLEDAFLPDEAEVADGLAQALGDALRGVGRAVAEQHAELVSAQARQDVGGADARLHDARHLLQQAVAGLVPAGVVDDLELVEVEVQQHVAQVLGLARRLQRLAEPELELATVDEPGEGVVRRLVGEGALQSPLLAHVVEDQ